MLSQDTLTKSPGNKVLSKTSYYSTPLYDDQGDRKALEELVVKLFNKKSPNKTETSPSPSPNGSKYKQLTMSKFCTTSRSKETQSRNEISRKGQNSSSKTTKKNRSPNKKNPHATRASSGRISKRGKNSNSKLPTINRWLKKGITENDKMEGSVNKKEKVDNTASKMEGSKKGKLDNTSRKMEGSKKGRLDNTSRKKPEEKKTKFKRSSSGSFDKYGISTPSIEDILEYQKNLENQQRCIENFDAEYEQQDSVEFNIEEPKTNTVVLDCTHLTNDEIDKAFNRNFQYVYEIFHGTRHSIRHEQFNKENCRDQSTVKDLKYNTSTITFTDGQKQLLLSHLDKKFNQGESLCTNTTRYFFQVLLPELCTKIFMDVHDMTFEEASKYLDDRPARHRTF